MRRVVVSGPIGSGKSTVGRLLARRGAVVIEADRIGHAVLEPEGEAHAAVADRWPDVVEDGRVNRARLARIVFSDRTELEALEALTHPHIGRKILAEADAAGDVVVAVELPLTVDILGDGWHRLVILATDDLRLERAVRRGMSEADVRSRMAAQASAERWREIADSLIVNDGDHAELAAGVDAWWDRVVCRPSGGGSVSV